MKTLLTMAVSLNGLISREDGDEDWLPHEGWVEFLDVANSLNNIVMGRKTYEQVTAKYQDSGFDDVECEHKIIVTRNNAFVAPEGYTVVHSPEQAIEHLQAKGIDTLYLIGGGKLNSEFMKRGLIDEIHLTINPYILGSGRSFVAQDHFELLLELIDSKLLSKGRVLLSYRVAK